jgi:cyclopropane fatty-acyl-phospholipid synthase-like methyltransferase
VNAIGLLLNVKPNGAGEPVKKRWPDFIQHYIFPGGMMPTMEIIRREAAAHKSKRSMSACSSCHQSR